MSLFVKFSKLFYKLAKADYENDVIVIFNTLMFLYKKKYLLFSKRFHGKKRFLVENYKILHTRNKQFVFTYTEIK